MCVLDQKHEHDSLWSLTSRDEPRQRRDKDISLGYRLHGAGAARPIDGWRVVDSTGSAAFAARTPEPTAPAPALRDEVVVQLEQLFSLDADTLQRAFEREAAGGRALADGKALGSAEGAGRTTGLLRVCGRRRSDVRRGGAAIGIWERTLGDVGAIFLCQFEALFVKSRLEGFGVFGLALGERLLEGLALGGVSLGCLAHGDLQLLLVEVPEVGERLLQDLLFGLVACRHLS